MHQPLFNKSMHVDSACIDQFLDGSRPAFDKIYNSYAGVIFQLILIRHKENVTAQFILEQTFITAWQKRRLFDASLQSMPGWLLHISRNLYKTSDMHPNNYAYHLVAVV